MQRTTNQKILLVFSIVEIIAAACAIILAFLAFAGGTILSGSAGANDLIEGMQITNTEAGSAAMAASVILLIAGIVSLIIGILGIRAANDSQKIKPVWVLAVIEVALGAIGVVLAIVNSSGMGDIASNVISLILSVVVLVVANNIKKEVFGIATEKGEAAEKK